MLERGEFGDLGQLQTTKLVATAPHQYPLS